MQSWGGHKFGIGLFELHYQSKWNPVTNYQVFKHVFPRCRHGAQTAAREHWGDLWASWRPNLELCHRLKEGSGGTLLPAESGPLLTIRHNRQFIDALHISDAPARTPSHSIAHQKDRATLNRKKKNEKNA